MIRRLAPADAAACRDLRLTALAGCPGAFAADHDEVAALPLAAFADRLAGGAVFAADRGGGGLDGMAGFYIRTGRKTCHRGTLWGIYVRPGARGRGLGRTLVALRLYRAAGFRRYGCERRALKLGDRYVDELLLTVRFDAGG